MRLVQALAAEPITINPSAESWGEKRISVTVTAAGVWGVGFSCVCLPRATAVLGVRFVKNDIEITRRIRQFRMMPTMEREIYLPFVTDALANNDDIGVQFYSDGAEVSLADLRLCVFQ